MKKYYEKILSIYSGNVSLFIQINELTFGNILEKIDISYFTKMASSPYMHTEWGNNFVHSKIPSLFLEK